MSCWQTPGAGVAVGVRVLVAVGVGDGVSVGVAVGSGPVMMPASSAIVARAVRAERAT